MDPNFNEKLPPAGRWVILNLVDKSRREGILKEGSKRFAFAIVPRMEDRF